MTSPPTAAHQAAGRCQSAQHDPLVPEILDDVGVQAAVDARRLDGGIEIGRDGAEVADNTQRRITLFGE